MKNNTINSLADSLTFPISSPFASALFHSQLNCKLSKLWILSFYFFFKFSAGFRFSFFYLFVKLKSALLWFSWKFDDPKRSVFCYWIEALKYGNRVKVSWILSQFFLSLIYLFNFVNNFFLLSVSIISSELSCCQGRSVWPVRKTVGKILKKRKLVNLIFCFKLFFLFLKGFAYFEFWILLPSFFFKNAFLFLFKSRNYGFWIIFVFY